MAERFQYPPPEIVAEVRDLANRSLSQQELNAYVSSDMSQGEREEIEALIVWFTRRYPTPLQRLRYARRAYDRAEQLMPPSVRRT